MPNNYWDTWRFGGADALLNVQAHDALRLWAELERAAGAPADAAPYDAAADAIARRFAGTFFSEATGRVVGAVDVRGESHDYGFTFVNLPAVASGLLDDRQTASVFDWLDGRRIVPGDASAGDDIYAFGFAPRGNTRDAAFDGGAWWQGWGGRLDPTGDGAAAYGRNVQNGGAILYVSYYDLHARLRALGPDGAAARLGAIAAEFARDGLRRQPVTPRYGHNTVVGVQGPFPESGLVPVFALDGLLGVRPTAGGLRIAPRLPGDWPSLRVNGVSYAGRAYDVLATRGGAAGVSDEGGRRVVTVPDGVTAVLSPVGTLAVSPEGGGR